MIWMICIIGKIRKIFGLCYQIVICRNSSQKFVQLSLLYQWLEWFMDMDDKKRTLGRESCIFHVRIRTLSSLGSSAGIFLGDCCGTTFSLPAAPPGRVIWIGCCGEWGNSRCKRDKKAFSPKMQIWSPLSNMINYLRVLLQPLQGDVHLPAVRVL